MKQVEHLDIANHSEYIVIKEAAEQIEHAYEPQKAIRTILSLISRQMGLNRGRILLEEGDSGFLHVAYSFGLTEDEIQRSRFSMGEGISGKVMHTGTPMIVSDIDKEDDYLFRTVDRSTLPSETVAFIATPIIRGGATIGVLAVNRLTKRSRSFDKDLGLLKLISLFISEILSVHSMLQKQTQILKEENEQLRSMALGQGSQFGIIGESSALMVALNKVSRAVNTSVTVLLKGESGTGKERFSRMLHLASHRQDGPFIAINCAAIPEELLESELFGHEKGAFTGAIQMKQGKIELANKGTLFLDEIGDLDLSLQAKLLRVLEERSITRIGGTRPIPIDARIIVASHKNLQDSVNQKTFRLDLFYRLNVFPIMLPPLRERDGDIRLLARHFLNQANQEYQSSAIFDQGALNFLEGYDWPGNIRQLENVIKRSVLLADDNRFITAPLIENIIIDESGIIHNTSNERVPSDAQSYSAESNFSHGQHLNDAFHHQPFSQPQTHNQGYTTQTYSNNSAFSANLVSSHQERVPPSFADSRAHNSMPNRPEPFKQQTGDKRNYWRVSEDESTLLQQALEAARGNKTQAASMLNMTPRQFSYRLKKLKLE